MDKQAQIIKSITKDNKYSLRTQISLSVALRRAVDAKRKLYGETLAEYLRKAILIRLMAEETEENELAILAKAVVGSVSKSRGGWKNIKNINTWQKRTRQKEGCHRS